MRVGSWLYRNYLRCPRADTAGRCIEFLPFVCSLAPVAWPRCHVLFLLWPDFLFLIVWSPSPQIFLICPCCISHTFWFLIFILCHIPGPRVPNLLFTSLSVKLFPRPCFKVLTLVCLWSQWPVAHLPTCLWLFIPAYFTSPCHSPWT